MRGLRSGNPHLEMNGIPKVRRSRILITPNEPKPTIMKTLLKRTGLASLTAACLAAPVLRAEITSWEPLAPVTPLNASPTKSIMASPQLITLTSGSTEKLYAAWAEQGGASSWTNQIRIAVYQDKIPGVAPRWEPIDYRVNGTTRGPTLGINYDPLAAAWFPQLVVHNGSLHATWYEDVPAKAGTISRIRVSRYNGDDNSPNWTFIDGNTAGGLNLNASENAIQPVAASYGSQLVVTWAETAAISRKARAQQVRVRAYNGSQWTWLDSGSVAGLNVDPNKSAQPARPVVVNVNAQPKLYVSFREPSSTGISRLRAKVHQGGSSWKVVDPGSGLNLNANRQVTSQFSGGDGASIFCVWSELNNAGVEQIRASRYDGSNDNAPIWQRLDGANPDQGLNYRNPLAYARPRAVQSFNGKIYVHWREEWQEAGISQSTCRVAVWDQALPAQNQWPWAWADGGGNRSNVEFNAPTSYTNSLTFGVYKNYLLLFNQELFPHSQPALGYVLVGMEAPAP